MRKIIRRKFAIALEMISFISITGFVGSLIGYVVPTMLEVCIGHVNKDSPWAIGGGLMGAFVGVLLIMAQCEKGRWAEKEDKTE